MKDVMEDESNIRRVGKFSPRGKGFLREEDIPTPD
jgi:hypothetical protein